MYSAGIPGPSLCTVVGFSVYSAGIPGPSLCTVVWFSVFSVELTIQTCKHNPSNDVPPPTYVHTYVLL